MNKTKKIVKEKTIAIKVPVKMHGELKMLAAWNGMTIKDFLTNNIESLLLTAKRQNNYPV